jgi:uroporphyrinogen-III synthase
MVVASRRAVTAVMAARDGRPLPPALRTAAVGAASAAALREAGAVEPLVAPEAGAAALAQALRGADRWPGCRVLLPRAAEGIAELGAVLRAEGAEAVEVIAYRTLARPAAEVARDWNEAAPEAAVFASPSAVHALAAGIGAPALRALRAVVAIGPTTAAALATLGITASVPATTGFEAAAALMRDLLDDSTANTTIRAAHAAGEEPNP